MSALSLAVALTVTPHVPILADDAGTEERAEKVAPSYEQQRKLRRSLALDSSDAAIREAEAYRDGDMPARYGLALTPSEEAEMDRRQHVIESTYSVRELVHEQPDRYGDVWIDHSRNGLAVIQIAPGGSEAELESRMKQAGAPDATYEIVRVKRATAELLQVSSDFLKMEAPRLSQEGYNVVSVGPFVQENAVSVGMEELSPGQERELEERYSDLDFFPEGPALDDDSQASSGGQWKSALHIQGGGLCTAGFTVANNYGNRYMVTAGHCGAGPWSHAGGPGYSITNNFHYNLSFADAQIIDIPEGLGSNVAVLTSSAGASIIGVKGYDAVGDIVCMTGAHPTPWNCGTISAVGRSHTVNGVTTQAMSDADYPAGSGDSGALVMTPLSSPVAGTYNTTIAGIHKGHSGFGTKWFSTRAGVFSELNLCCPGTNYTAQVTPVFAPLPNLTTSKCLGVWGASTADNAVIDQYTCVNAANQLFAPVPRWSNYQLVAQHSGKCVNVYGGLGGDNVQLVQWPCVGAANERFSLNPQAGPLNFKLRAEHSGKCARPQSGSGVQSTPVVQDPCAASASNWGMY